MLPTQWRKGWGWCTDGWGLQNGGVVLSGHHGAAHQWMTGGTCLAWLWTGGGEPIAACTANWSLQGTASSTGCRKDRAATTHTGTQKEQFAIRTPVTVWQSWKLLGMLKLIVDDSFQMIKHANEWLVTSIVTLIQRFTHHGLCQVYRSLACLIVQKASSTKVWKCIPTHHLSEVVCGTGNTPGKATFACTCLVHKER